MRGRRGASSAKPHGASDATAAVVDAKIIFVSEDIECGPFLEQSPLFKLAKRGGVPRLGPSPDGLDGFLGSALWGGVGYLSAQFAISCKTTLEG